MEEKCLSVRLLESWMMSDWWIPRPIGKRGEYLKLRVEMRLYKLLLFSGEQEMKTKI
jgi:hypothetical protein